MSNNNLTLWIDTQNNTLSSGWQSLTQAQQLLFTQGDTASIEVHMVDSSTGTASEIEFPVGSTLKCAIGRIDKFPTSGSFDFTYGANTITIPVSSTISSVNSLINAMPSVIADGGVSVIFVNGTTFRISFNTNGAKSLASISPTKAYPKSTSTSVVISAGTSVSNEIQHVRLKTIPVAYSEDFSISGTPTISINQITSNVSRISISSLPKYGNFVISNGTKTTAAISCLASANDILAALQLAGISSTSSPIVGNTYSVTKNNSLSWDISRTFGSPETLSVNSVGFVGFSTMTGLLNMNSAEVEDLLGGSLSVNATIEIELKSGNKTQTLYQGSVTILNDLIDDGVYEPTILPSIISDAPFDNNTYGRRNGSWVIGGGGTWGSITGTLSNQTDLYNALGERLSRNGDYARFLGFSQGNGPSVYVDDTTIQLYQSTLNASQAASCDLSNTTIGFGNTNSLSLLNSSFITSEKSDGSNVYSSALTIKNDKLEYLYSNGTDIGSVYKQLKVKDIIESPSISLNQYSYIQGDAIIDQITGDTIGYLIAQDVGSKNEINSNSIRVSNFNENVVANQGYEKFSYVGKDYIRSGVNPYTVFYPNVGFIERQDYSEISSIGITAYTSGPTGTYYTQIRPYDIRFRDGSTQNTAGVSMTYVQNYVTSQMTYVPCNYAYKVVQIARNTTGSVIPAGTVVYISGANGTHPTISLAQANAESTSYRTLGVTEFDVGINLDGNVILSGEISNLNTGSFADGDQLYLSPTVAGRLTNVKPSAPNHMVYVAVCVRANNNNGVISVRVANGFELNELHNVANSSLADNDILAYESSTSLWKNKTFSSLGLLTSATAASTYQTQSGMSSYALLSGATFAGKVTTPSTTASGAGFNIGAGTAPTTPVAGDIWMQTAGNYLYYRAPAGVTYTLAMQQFTNTFSSPQIIDTTSNTLAGLRVTQKGTSPALVVEDSLNPDATSFVIDANGNVGVGVDPATWSATQKVEINGSIKFTADGSVQSKAWIDAPSDGGYYVRRNGAWVKCTVVTTAGVNYLTV